MLKPLIIEPWELFITKKYHEVSSSLQLHAIVWPRTGLRFSIEVHVLQNSKQNEKVKASGISVLALVGMNQYLLKLSQVELNQFLLPDRRACRQ